MIAKDCIGKTITAVRQSRFYNEHLRRFEYELSQIELSDGSFISFYAVETIEQPCVTACVVKEQTA